MHGKDIKTRYYWVDIDLAVREGLTFYQTRSNAVIFQGIFPAYCLPKVVRLKTGEVLIEKVSMSPQPPPRSHWSTNGQENWVRNLLDDQKGKLLDNQKEKFLDKQNSSNQPNQLQIQFVTDRGDLMTCKMEETRPVLRRSMLILKNEGLGSSDRTGRPVVCEDKMSLNVEQTHDRTVRLVATLHTAASQDDSQVFHEADTFNVDDEVFCKRMEKSIAVHDENHEPMMVNEADMDFRIPGLPHSVVKYAQSTSVPQLIQKIENHPDRHALQKDLQQNQSYNPFSPE